jgi:hypothetical protein
MYKKTIISNANSTGHQNKSKQNHILTYFELSMKFCESEEKHLSCWFD